MIECDAIPFFKGTARPDWNRLEVVPLDEPSYIHSPLMLLKFYIRPLFMFLQKFLSHLN